VTFYTQISETTVCGAYRPSYDMAWHAVRITAAILNSRSAAAVLGRVALLFRKRNTWQTCNTLVAKMFQTTCALMSH